jgi:hypothetical protein
MPHGGRRRGAGRPLGSKSKKPHLLSADIVVESDAANAADALIDVMKKIAHDPNADAALRLDAAKTLAPYLIARIRSRSPDIEKNVSRVVVLQPVAIPADCFLTKEQIENPASLMEHAVPMPLTDVARPAPEVHRPRSARVYAPTSVAVAPAVDPAVAPAVDPLIENEQKEVS